MKSKRKISDIIVTLIMIVMALTFIYPIVMVLFNSFKETSTITTDTVFTLPTKENFVALENYIYALEAKGFFESLKYSLFITLSSVLAICVCCSMCAWFITRVKGVLSSALYYLFVFSMVVPFQMVMFTLSRTADRLDFNTPWNIWIIYLGFGAGLAVFMFTGFMKSIPLEIEEAAMIDGCNPLQTFFKIVMPMLKPTMVSVAILEAMWVWNDYLLPTLVLDIREYQTIPMLIQTSFKGGYGRVEMGAMMACIMLTVIPIVIVYLLGQKHIIKGVAAGAVKG
ncbi:MAG: carbohydrate ABC transporter permease [Lachnospiraceae bacterium]|nr:carbohydrate ABC transporter permease [Lachnospiraceae bacterium]